MKQRKQVLSALMAAVTFLTTLPTIAQTATETADAAVSYPVQEFLMGIGDTNRNVNISAMDAGTPATSAKQSGTDNEKWTLNYIDAGVYEIVSAASGQVLTADASGYATLTVDTDAANQRWKIASVEKDYDGYALYYSIVSNADSNKALTFIPETNSFSLDSYSGGIYQKYKLNLDGLEGFAANCMTDSGEKAGTIGGLLGPTVFVSTADELEKQLDSVGAQTIVVTANIDMQSKSHTRIRDNKTLVGSYSAKTIYDSQFRTNDVWGAEDDSPSDNIVFRNLDMQAKNIKDRILINIWSSRQIWIDHINFNSTLSYDKSGNGLDEVGKFIWLNTPYESYHDAKDMWRSPDYMTISYCKFTNRYWTVAYGTQNGEITRDRTTLLYNWWNGNIRRCPQIGNGSAHVYNNYYNGQSGSNNPYTSQIIGGDNSDIVSERNRFDGIVQNQAFAIGDLYRDADSYLSTSIGGTPSKVNFSVKNPSTWYPNKTNYGYSLLDSYNNSNTDTKAFCTTYAGCTSNGNELKYITDSDFSSWVTTKYDSPFLKDIECGELATGKEGAFFHLNNTYSFRNSGSGLYLTIADGKAEVGADVIQSAMAENASKWTLRESGNNDGYYYILSQLGDGKTYFLDLANGKADNGTNIGIWTDTSSDAQLFKFVRNEDGTYLITTKVTKDKSAVGITAGSTQSGASAIQWACDGSPNQSWIVEANSTLIQSMEIKDVAEIANWYINPSAAVGNLVFGDRDVTYTSLPDAVQGAEAIATACNSKNTNGDLAVITAAKDVTVYIAFDQRVSAIPAWASGFNKTGLTAINSKDVKFDLYSTELSAGNSLTLGTNGQSASCVNYTVFIAEKVIETTTTTTVTTTTTTSATSISTTSETTTTTTATTTATTETQPTETTTSATETTAESITSLTTTSTTTTTEIIPIEAKYGDLNMDSAVSLVDVVILNKSIAKTLTLNDVQRANADCLADGDINPLDSTALLSFIIEVIESLPVYA